MLPLPPRCAILLARAKTLDRVHRYHRHAAQPPGLAAQAEKPLEAGPSHPGRSPRNATREVVEGAAHTNAHGNTASILQAVDPQLLLWGAKSDEEDLCPVRPDQGDRFLVGRRIGRAGVSGNSQPSVFDPQPLGEFVRYTGLCSEQKNPEATFRAQLRERREEGGARETPAHPAALACRGPPDDGAGLRGA